MHARATLRLVLIVWSFGVSNVRAQEAAEPVAARALSRVDASAPLSGGERWVKDNGRWRLQRINYRYLDHADYAPRPAPPATRDDFAEPHRSDVTLRMRWFGRPSSGWRSRWGASWGVGWGQGWGGYARSPWTWRASPWSPGGYGGWRGIPRYGWGNGGYRGGLGFGLGLSFGHQGHRHRRGR